MVPVLANIGSFWQWAILFAIILVVFGAKRLPEIARNLGKSLGEFKKARREFEEELMKVESSIQTPPPTTPTPLGGSTEKRTEKDGEE